MGGGGQRQRQRGRQSQQQQQKKEPQHFYGGKESKVSEPKVKTFMNSKGDNIWLVQYYSVEVSQCQDFIPTYESLANAFKKVLKVGAFNCDENPEVCQKANIESYPTLKLHYGGKNLVYSGSIRSKKDIHTWIKEKMPSSNIANIIKPQQLDKLIQETKEKEKAKQEEELDEQATASNSIKPLALYFTSSYETPIDLKSLAWKYREDVTFAEVRASNKALAGLFGVESYPTLLVFCEGSINSNNNNNNDNSVHTSVVEINSNNPNNKITSDLLQSTFRNSFTRRKCRDFAKKYPRRSFKKELILTIEEQEGLEKLRVKELRTLLEDVGEECKGCVQKSDFIEKILSVAEIIIEVK